MNLLEYEAKKLLAEAGIATPRSVILRKASLPQISLPAVLKSQVPVGGRGKLGGVRIVEQDDELQAALGDLFSLSIKNHLPKVLLAEEKLDIERELYLAILIDRQRASIEIVAHSTGGVEVEANESSDFLHITLDGKNSVRAGEQLAEYFGLETQVFVLQDMVENLYRCFIAADATLLEINPLILTTEGQLVAGDCKMILDDAAAFRHPEWNFENMQHDANFVTLHETGNIATIANGAGLAMATVDAVIAGDMIPANFLDIGGGASEATILAAFEKIMTFPNVKAIIINIFAGITKCDEVARAIVAAKKNIEHLPPLCIRLAGTNYEEAFDILATEQISLLPTLEECIATAKEATYE